MNLVPYDLNKINNPNGYKYSKNHKIITEFAESDLDCVKVEGWTHRTAEGCTWSLNNSIRCYKVGGIKAITRKGEVFLIKTAKLDKETLRIG